MSDIKLLPFPFCGSKAQIDDKWKAKGNYSNGDVYSYYIICTNCRIHTVDQFDKHDVITKWNSRIKEPNERP